MKPNRSEITASPALLWLIGSLVLAAAGVVLVLYNTRYGPGISGDSTYYLQGALNLLAGQGFSRFSGGWEAIPITGFPPFYSIALIIPAWIHSNLTESARVLNAILFGGVIFGTSLIIYRFSPHAWGTALLGAGFVLASQAMVLYASWVMAELLFIFLMLLAVYISMRYFNAGSVGALVAASLIIAAAILTRYVAISVGGALGLAVLFFGRKSWKKRLLDAALVAVLCLGPFFLWLQRNARVAGTLVNREFSLHVIPEDLLIALASEIISWFVPRSEALPPALRVSLFVLLALGILVLFVLLERKRRVSAANSAPTSGTTGVTHVLLWMLLLLVPLYLAILIANSLFLDASTSLGAARRYLLPVYVAVVMLIALVLHRSLSSGSWKLLPKVVVIGYVFLLFGVTIRETAMYLQQPSGSLGYTDRRRAWVDVVGTLAEIDPDRRLISNNVELVYVLADRPAYAFPIAYDHYIEQERADFEAQFDLARRRLEEGAVIVYFGALKAGDKKILADLGAEPWRRLEQAVFYTLNGE